MTRRVVRKKAPVALKEVHYTRSFHQQFRASLSERIERLVICSPYFGVLPSPFNSVLEFCVIQQRRGVQRLEIITRPPGADETALTTGVAKELAKMGVDLYVRVSPYLHAKFYHFDFTHGFFRSFVGSSNFTMGGLSRNYELMAELEGVGMVSPCHREIASPTYSWWPEFIG